MSYKQLINYDNYYIYDDGRVYSISLQIKLIDNNKKRKGFLVHRLVYEVFKGPIQEGFEIDHEDGKRDNNKLINLRLLTKKENIQNKHHLEIYKEVDKKRYIKDMEIFKKSNKKYREEHKEEIKLKKREYYEKNREKYREYYENNKEEILRKKQNYYQEHKDEINRRRRERYYSKNLNN